MWRTDVTEIEAQIALLLKKEEQQNQRLATIVGNMTVENDSIAAGNEALVSEISSIREELGW